MLVAMLAKELGDALPSPSESRDSFDGGPVPTADFPSWPTSGAMFVTIAQPPVSRDEQAQSLGYKNAAHADEEHRKASAHERSEDNAAALPSVRTAAEPELATRDDGSLHREPEPSRGRPAGGDQPAQGRRDRDGTTTGGDYQVGSVPASVSTPPLTSHERMVRDVVHGIGGCGAIESGRICIQNKGHAEPCFETTAEAENAKPRCHRTLGCARDREHGGACDPRTSEASTPELRGTMFAKSSGKKLGEGGTDCGPVLCDACSRDLDRESKAAADNASTARTKEASPEPKWETLYRQCVGQLSVLAGALGNTNGDPEVSLPASAKREAVVWADEISPFNGAQVKALLEENERLRQGSETPNRCRGCKGILTQATHCNDCAPVTGGEGT